MTNVEHITIEAADPEAAGRFYTALGLGERVRVRASNAATTGFRGFTLSLVVAQPSIIDALVEVAVEAGATVIKPSAKSLWGYGGVVQAPDGTIVTLASSSKKNTGPATRQIDDVVVQLGADDVAASKRYYAEQGVKVAKSYGKYVELDTRPITVALYKRSALAKVAGVPPEGSGSHRVAIGGGSAFTDPDGFAWE